MIGDVFVLRKPGELSLLNVEPILGSAPDCMAELLLGGHVGSADPVLVLSLALQMVHHVAPHLPGDGPGSAVLSNPLLPSDPFLQ